MDTLDSLTFVTTNTSDVVAFDKVNEVYTVRNPELLDKIINLVITHAHGLDTKNEEHWQNQKEIWTSYFGWANLLDEVVGKITLV